MSRTLAPVRKRIEAQGFLGLDDRTLAQINYPLRLAPAICSTWAALGTALASPAALWALTPFALLGAVLPWHPFDALYQLGIRPLLGRPPLPRYPLPRRLSCLLATFFLAGAAVGFETGHPVLGHALGWSLAALALVNATTGFCVPSFIYGRLFGPPACR
jgi:Domain of unknown function (DUF4395)